MISIFKVLVLALLLLDEISSKEFLSIHSGDGVPGKKLFVIFFLLFTLVVTSCGGQSGGRKNNQSSKNSFRPQLIDHKKFKAILRPISGSMYSAASGVVNVNIEDDEFVVEQSVEQAQSGVRHFQAIMTGSSCEGVDENLDGYIDLFEGSKTFGSRLIPLDSDLGSQLDGQNFGPIANEDETYVYKRRTSLSRLLSDLTAADPNFDDDLIKLNSPQDLYLHRRVVLVLGTSSELPETVAGLGIFSAQEGYPIACGELVPVLND